MFFMNLALVHILSQESVTGTFLLPANDLIRRGPRLIKVLLLILRATSACALMALATHASIMSHCDAVGWAGHADLSTWGQSVVEYEVTTIF